MNVWGRLVDHQGSSEIELHCNSNPATRGRVKLLIFSLLFFLPLASCTSTPDGIGPELFVLDAVYAPSYTLSGPISELYGSATVLSNTISPSGFSFLSSRSEDLNLEHDAGSFSFVEQAYTGESFEAAVEAHPRSPTQFCTMTNGTGQVENSNIEDISITCEGAYRVITNLSGLSGTGLVLNSTSGDSVSVSASGAIEMPTPYILSDPYEVSITSNPIEPWQTCTFTGGATTVSGYNSSENDLTIADITCTTNQYAVTASLSGLVNSGLHLTLNGTDVEITAGSTSYTLGQVSSGSEYTVALASNPVGQECQVFGGTGSISDGGVSVEVSCIQTGYMVGGTLSNYAGSGLVLTATGSHGESKTITAGSTGYYFDNSYNHNDTYSISVSTNPTSPWQHCVVTQNATGTITESSGSMTSADIACTTDQYTLDAGSITGLTYTGLVLSVNGSNYTIAAGSTSASLGSWDSGTDYTVSVASQPTYQTCTVSGGTGTVTGANISSVSVSCSYNSYSVTAQVSGLLNSDTVTISDPTYGTVVSGNTSGFTAYTLEHLSNYVITASATGYTCTVTGGEYNDGTGQVFGASVSDIAVSCSPNSYTLAGTVSGLVGADQATLYSGTGSSANFSNGSSTFFTLTHGTDYAITTTVSGYSCSITGGTNGDGSGRVNAAAITGVAVVCTPNTYTLSGSIVTGVGSGGLAISGDSVNVSVSGVSGSPSDITLSYATPTGSFTVTHGDSYIPSTPTGYTGCSISSGATGTVNAATPTAFVVICTADSYNVKYTLTNYDVGNTTTDKLTVGSLTSPTFNSTGDVGTLTSIGSLTRGSDYSVTVTDPSYQVCLADSSGGTSIIADFDVNINCSNDYFTLSVTVSGLNTAGETVDISLNGGADNELSFDTSTFTHNYGYITGTYELTITSMPSSKVCAFEEVQYGTIGSNLALNINCVAGYSSAEGVLDVPAARFDYRLYQGKATTLITNAEALMDNATGVSYYNGYLYITDAVGNQIVTYEISGGSKSTLPTSLSNSPRHGVVDGTNLYYSEESGTKDVVKVDIGTGTQVASYEMGGTGNPSGLALDRTNQILYVAMRSASSIKKIDLTTGTVSDLTTDASIDGSEDLVLLNNKLYVATFGNRTIVEIDLAGPTVTLFAGTGTAGFRDGPRLSALFQNTEAITTDGTDLYIGEGGHIRKLDMKTGIVSTIAGNGTSEVDGTGIGAGLSNLIGLSSDGRSLYALTDSGSGKSELRKISDNGLVGYWPLSSSGVAPDYASDVTTQQDATINGATFTANDGRYGTDGAYVFDGSDYIKAGLANLPSGSASSTICAWINPTSLPASSNYSVIAAYGDNNASAGTERFLSLTDSGIRFTGLGGRDVDANIAIPTGKWTHLCATYEKPASTERQRIYMNGHLVKSASVSGWSTGTTGSLFIGGWYNGSTFKYYFTGSIADVRIYSRALNDGEINELAQSARAYDGTASDTVDASFSTGPTGLLASYDFIDEDGSAGGASPTLTDYRGPLGYTLTATGSPTGVTGKEGDTEGAYDFDGTTQYLETTTSTGLPPGSHPRTICAWVKPSTLPASNAYSIITSYGTNSTYHASGLSLYNESGTQKVNFFGYGDDVSYAFNLSLNTWTFLCGTYDVDQLATIYINGKEVQSETKVNWDTYFTKAVYPDAYTDDGLRIGNQLGLSEYFDGAIDDVRIYNNALSSDQIRQLAAQLPNGLVARYDFTDNGGADEMLKDVSGFSGTLTNGGYGIVTDRFSVGSAASFNGLDEKLYTSLGTFLPQGDSARTMCAWIDPDDYPASSDVYAILHHGDAAANNGHTLFLRDSSDFNQIGSGFWNGEDAYMSSYTQFSAGTWNLACGVRSSSENKFYLNGTLVVDASIPANTLAINSSDFYIGIDSTSHYFKGKIDEVTVYNRALSAEEIAAMQRGYGGVLDVTRDNASAQTTMSTKRTGHTSTLLPNGKVLIAGGFDNDLVPASYNSDSADLYDPATGTFTAVGSMNSGRAYHTATLLSDGRVLIAGGMDAGNNPTNTVEIFDPSNNSFTTLINALNEDRYEHTATLLSDGTVLFTGGRITAGFSDTAEIYDPSTGLFKLTTNLGGTNMKSIRIDHTATLLSDGTVLIAGGSTAYNSGYLKTAEIYDPDTHKFNLTSADMSSTRSYHSATLLLDGTVLISGGENGSDLKIAEIFDPSDNKFYLTNSYSGGTDMGITRSKHTSTLLSDGTVLIAGGSVSIPYSNYIYDPSTYGFTASGNMSSARALNAATLLPDGSVLITGGGDLNTAEIFE